jgi:UDP-N-acetylmuramoyl-tripeptide--D-alanyl-D-alanine ligase
VVKILVTGSEGKTTLKAIMRQMFGTGASARILDNLNTYRTVSAELELDGPSSDITCLEAGTNSPGELVPITQLVNPHILVITSITTAHLGCFDGEEGLVKEKLSPISVLKAGASVVYPGSSRHVARIRQEVQKYGHRGWQFGGDVHEASVALIKKEIDAKRLRTMVEAQAAAGLVKYELKTIGDHYVTLSLAALTTLLALGFDLNEYISKLEMFEPFPGRGQILHVCHDGIKYDVVDDTYNASPEAMKASLRTLAALPNVNKIALIGQMLELGTFEAEIHDQIAKQLSEMKLKKAHFIGPEHLWPIMNRYREVECHPEINEAIALAIIGSVTPGTVILAKASRKIQLDKFVTIAKDLSHI